MISYAPIVEAATGDLVALRVAPDGARAHTSLEGARPADELVSVAHTVHQHLHGWHDQGLSPLPVTIELPEGVGEQGALPPGIEDALVGSSDDAALLQFSLPESAFEDVVERQGSPIVEIQALGAGIWLRLRRCSPAALHWARILGVEGIELDVARLGADRALRMRVMGAAEEARAIGLPITARNVDAPEQLQYQRVIRCERVQGRALSGPLAWDEVAEYLPPQTVAASTLPGASQERRARRRLPVLLIPDRAERSSQRGGVREPIEAVLVDLGEGGAQLRASAPIPVDGQLHLTMRLPGDPNPEPVQLSGAAVSQDRLGGAYSINTRFVGTSLLDKQRVARFIQRECASGGSLARVVAREAPAAA